MSIKKKGLAVAGALGLAMAASTASAGLVDLYAPFTLLEDDQAEWEVNVAGGTAGVLEVGDRLVSIVEFTNSQEVLGGQQQDFAADGFELTGIVDITVVGKVAVAPGLFNFVFAPSGAAGLLAGEAAGTVASLWTDTTPDLSLNGTTNCVSQADCVTKATDGSHWISVGFTGDTDEQWVALGAPDSLATVAAGFPGQDFGSVNFALGITENNTGRLFREFSCLPFCDTTPDATDDLQTFVNGSGSIKGGIGVAAGGFGAFASGDFDANLAVIPEPGSLALLGLGLLGLGGVARKRKQA